MLHPHLDFSVLMLSADKEKEKSIKSSISLIADTIFSALQFQDYLATAWLNVLEKVKFFCYIELISEKSKYIYLQESIQVFSITMFRFTGKTRRSL